MCASTYGDEKMVLDPLEVELPSVLNSGPPEEGPIKK